MNTRELIILILGLAIFAVVLRGLYVALKARRGQIKLSIDKNIPQDTDLEAMELAELPGGGARVVDRSLESVNVQNSKLDAAQERATALSLGDLGSSEANIPVLMDAVELGNAVTVSIADSERISPSSEFAAKGIEKDLEKEIEEETEQFNDQEYDHVDPASLSSEFDDQEWSHNTEPLPAAKSVVEDYIEDEIYSGATEFLSPIDENDDDQGLKDDHRVEIESGDEYDDVLLDYDQNDIKLNDNVAISETDALASIAPDYPETLVDVESDEDAVEDDLESDEPSTEKGFHRLVPEQSVQIEEEVSDQDDWDEQNNLEANSDSDLTKESGHSTNQSFEQQLDDFSMTAGDRIGYDNNIIKAAAAARSNSAPKTTDSQPRLSEQPSFFDDAKPGAEDDAQSAVGITKKTSFFSAFRRKPKKELKQSTATEIDQKIDEGSGERKTYSEEIEEPSRDSFADEAADAEDTLHHQSNDKATQPSEVLVVNVMARAGYSFAGDDLLQILITAGLKFGEMNIFHHHLDSNTKGPVLYSVANVLNPGTFDLNNMSDFSTLGVSFFLALPTSINNLEAFETMLSVAQKIKGGLDGELRDDQRNLMTAQTIEHYRQRVRDFELRQLKAGIRS
ncbi:MAG: cell division protein ZipA [Pseudohongiellaceae bacterium]|jgi:cell division protein ZipA